MGLLFPVKDGTCAHFHSQQLDPISPRPVQALCKLPQSPKVSMCVLVCPEGHVILGVLHPL